MIPARCLSQFLDFLQLKESDLGVLPLDLRHQFTRIVDYDFVLSSLFESRLDFAEIRVTRVLGDFAYQVGLEFLKPFLGDRCKLNPSVRVIFEVFECVIPGPITLWLAKGKPLEVVNKIDLFLK